MTLGGDTPPAHLLSCYSPEETDPMERTNDPWPIPINCDGVPMSAEEHAEFDRMLHKARIDPVALREAQERVRPDKAFWRYATEAPEDPRWTLLKKGNFETMWRLGLLVVIRSVSRENDGRHWLHVSVSKQHSLPTYAELCRIKETFIGRDRKAIQIFAPRQEHVNIHPFCLHLFACLEGDPMPDFTSGTGSV